MNNTQSTKPANGAGESNGQNTSPPQRPSSADTEQERPTSGQAQAPSIKGEEASQEEEEDDKEEEGYLDADPSEQISSFDWENLSQRYHDAIQDCQHNEDQLMQEWESLMNFFKIWAEAGHTQETDRTYRRLRTRMAHVQHSEDNLEKKRLHYIKVVEAFQSALSLLQVPVG